MNFLELAKERYSCRGFMNKPVEDEKIAKILVAANVAPTATNAQPFHVWVIRTEEGLRKVNEATRFGFGAPLVIVVGGKPEQAWTRKYDGRNFADVDASIVATHIMLEAQDLGLGTTWVGVIDVEKIRAHFPEMEGYDLVGLFPIGYPAEDDSGKPSKMHDKRKSFDEIISYL